MKEDAFKILFAKYWPLCSGFNMQSQVITEMFGQYFGWCLFAALVLTVLDKSVFVFDMDGFKSPVPLQYERMI